MMSNNELRQIIEAEEAGKAIEWRKKGGTSWYPKMAGSYAFWDTWHQEYRIKPTTLKREFVNLYRSEPGGRYFTKVFDEGMSLNFVQGWTVKDAELIATHEVIREAG